MLAVPWGAREPLDDDQSFDSAPNDAVSKFMHSEIEIKLLTIEKTLRFIGAHERDSAEVRLRDSMLEGGLVLDDRGPIIPLRPR